MIRWWVICTGEECVGGVTVIGTYRRGVWRYDSDRYVQERSVGGGMTVIGMYRRGVWGV
ncbi:unnamed protein product [Staurois parvus]|uniref:Uncharacterized protein n=1 Tax=Staurois parvus TaxID=386267 RepID=A0ABN9B5U9_9NEOB|nr:unnamed protein product [Staurois parvus]